MPLTIEDVPDEAEIPNDALDLVTVDKVDDEYLVDGAPNDLARARLTVHRTRDDADYREHVWYFQQDGAADGVARVDVAVIDREYDDGTVVTQIDAEPGEYIERVDDLRQAQALMFSVADSRAEQHAAELQKDGDVLRAINFDQAFDDDNKGGRQ